MIIIWKTNGFSFVPEMRFLLRQSRGDQLISCVSIKLLSVRGTLCWKTKCKLDSADCVAGATRTIYRQLNITRHTQRVSQVLLSSPPVSRFGAVANDARNRSFLKHRESRKSSLPLSAALKWDSDPISVRALTSFSDPRVEIRQWQKASFLTAIKAFYADVPCPPVTSDRFLKSSASFFPSRFNQQLP